MVHAAHIESLHLRRAAGERHGRVDVAHEQDSDARVRLPVGHELRRLVHGREDDLDLWRHAHPVEVLLPVAAADFVIDEHNERDVQWLAPPDYDLPVDQAVIDAVQR